MEHLQGLFDPDADHIGSFCTEMNEEVGEWVGREEHPLLNEVILEKLFEYVRRRDLLACRGVSKKWNVLTIPSTRSKFTLRIQSSNKMEEFVAVFSKNELGIPFAKFNLRPFCTAGGIGQQFLELCGDTTTELELRQHEEGNEVFKVEDVSELLRKMKRLEKLSMSQVIVSESGNVVELFPGSKPKLSLLKSLTLETHTPKGTTVDCPTFLEELITAAENISDFTTSYNSPAMGIQALTVIEKLGKESIVQTLSLRGDGMRPLIEILSRMVAKPKGLKLKKLSIGLDFDEKTLKTDNFQLIELFKDTLEDLDMSSRFVHFNFTNFQKMPKLRRLDLNLHGNLDSSLINLNKIFPMLKELELSQLIHHPQPLEEFFPQSEPCPTMKSLILLDLFRLRINTFNHVLTIFPRLTQLKIEVEEDGAEIIRQIWTRMTQLEFLSISGRGLRSTESMDSLFTGISTNSSEGREMMAVANDLRTTTVQCRRETILKLRNQHSQLPSIGNLTNLRCLELNVFAWDRYGNWLTDVTGFLGFYSLKHLRRLVLRNCNLTKECCEILTMEIEVGLESWKFTVPGENAIIPGRTC